MKSRFPILTMLLLTACGSGADPNQEGALAMPSAQPPVIARVAPASPSADELVAYLHLEFGESPTDPGALEAKDLEFFGTVKFPDRTEHIWQFPCSADTGCWLRVTENSTGSVTNWSDDPPPGA